MNRFQYTLNDSFNFQVFSLIVIHCSVLHISNCLTYYRNIINVEVILEFFDNTTNK